MIKVLDPHNPRISSMRVTALTGQAMELEKTEDYAGAILALYAPAIFFETQKMDVLP